MRCGIQPIASPATALEGEPTITSQRSSAHQELAPATVKQADSLGKAGASSVSGRPNLGDGGSGDEVVDLPRGSEEGGS